MLIDGVLVGYSDYDLLLDIRGPMPSATNWYKPDRSGLMAVDRAGISRVFPLRFK